MSVLLSEHLPLLATAPDGIQKLRGLILELAVRGKLVPQDLNDEPASELLKRIAKERARLEAEGACKKSKAMPVVGDDEHPFALPEGWGWVRLGVTIELISGQHLTPDEYMDGLGAPIPYLTGPAEFGPVSPNPTRSTKQTRAIAVSGDILLTVKGSGVGKLNRVNQTQLAISRQLMAVRTIVINSEFTELVLRSSEQHFQDKTVGIAIPGIGRDDVQGLVVGLPPLAEQHRIVAKVDELMALCDRLEAEQTDAETAHAKLVETLLGTLTQSVDASELAANWQRLAEHFDTLFTTESSLDALKQTVLQLAIMGKLVPQDPNDEPASELLRRIAQERARLEADGTCKKTKPMPLVGQEEQPFALPLGWEWTRLADTLAVVTDGDHLPPPKANDGVPFLVIGNLNAGQVSFEGCRFVPDSYFNALDWSRRPGAGDLLYTVTGSYGITIPVLTNSPFCVQRHVAILKSLASSPTPYLLRYLQSRSAKAFADSVATGIAQKTVTLGALRVMPIAVPPADEQHRIVAKVDELMALCDRLKADLTESRTRQARLSTTLIQSALQNA